MRLGNKMQKTVMKSTLTATLIWKNLIEIINEQMAWFVWVIYKLLVPGHTNTFSFESAYFLYIQAFRPH